MGSTSLNFPVPLFAFLCHWCHQLTTLPSTSSSPSYSCVLLYLFLSPQPLSLTAWFLFLFYRACHALAPSLPPCPRLCLFDILSPCRLALSLSYSSVILPCSCQISCPHSLSPCPTSSFFIVSLRQPIDKSGTALWPVPKKVNYMSPISFFNGYDLLETLLL